MIKTPKEKAEQRKKDQEKIEKLLKFHKTNFNTVVATEEGLDVFRFIMDICGYQKRSVLMDSQTGEVNKEATVYLEARRSIYLDIRQYISPKFLKKIEFK